MGSASALYSQQSSQPVGSNTKGTWHRHQTTWSQKMERNQFRTELRRRVRALCCVEWDDSGEGWDQMWRMCRVKLNPVTNHMLIHVVVSAASAEAVTQMFTFTWTNCNSSSPGPNHYGSAQRPPHNHTNYQVEADYFSLRVWTCSKLAAWVNRLITLDAPSGKPDTNLCHKDEVWTLCIISQWSISEKLQYLVNTKSTVRLRTYLNTTWG